MGQETTRLDVSSAELRQAAVRGGGGRVACRLLAVALVLEGASRKEAANACGIDRQTLCDWCIATTRTGSPDW
jgi:hypothetical protein